MTNIRYANTHTDTNTYTNTNTNTVSCVFALECRANLVLGLGLGNQVCYWTNWTKPGRWEPQIGEKPPVGFWLQISSGHDWIQTIDGHGGMRTTKWSIFFFLAQTITISQFNLFHQCVCMFVKGILRWLLKLSFTLEVNTPGAQCRG